MEELEDFEDDYMEDKEIEDNDEPQEEQWEQQEDEEPEDPKLKPKKTIRKPKKKLVIPDNAHPLEVFLLTYDFGWGELIGITSLSKELLLGIIRGDTITKEVQQRIRLTTGVKLCG